MINEVKTIEYGNPGFGSAVETIASLNNLQVQGLEPMHRIDTVESDVLNYLGITRTPLPNGCYEEPVDISVTPGSDEYVRLDYGYSSTLVIDQKGLITKVMSYDFDLDTLSGFCRDDKMIRIGLSGLLDFCTKDSMFYRDPIRILRNTQSRIVHMEVTDRVLDVRHHMYWGSSDPREGFIWLGQHSGDTLNRGNNFWLAGIDSLGNRITMPNRIYEKDIVKGFVRRSFVGSTTFAIPPMEVK